MIETDDSLLTRPHHSLSHSTADFAMPSHDASDDVPDRVIYPRSGWIRVDWKELYAYRELLGFLVLRDVSVRYKQTVLGSAWAIIQPVTMMVLFTLVFGQIAKIPTADVPYGRDLRLMDSVKDVSDLPREGKNLIVVTDINNVLHLRVFDSDGKMAVDTDEHKLTDKVQQVEELKQQLKRLPHPDELTGKEKDRLIIAVTSIVSRNLPYAVFVFAGLIPMTLFSQGFTKASASLALEEHLMSKVYFPRIMVPIAGIAVFLVDLVISFGLYAVILLYYGIMPSWTVVFVPVLVALTFIATMSFGLLFSCLMVFYRDFRYLVPFMSQIVLYLSPVIYPLSMVRNPTTRWIMSLNPMFGIVPAYRSAILGGQWDIPCLAISTVTALVSCTFAICYFRRTEHQFVDFV